MYKLAIFDLDGTLIDTLSSITASVNIMREEMGSVLVDKRIILPFVGKGSANMLQALCNATPDSMNMFVTQYNKIYEENLFNQLQVYQGIGALLANLKADGIKVAVVTNKYHRQALDILEYCFKQFSFDAIQGVTDEALKKPNPTQTLALLKQLGVQSHEAVFIGDSVIDQQTARAAAIDFKFISWGYGKAEQLTLNPNEIIHSASELQKSILGTF